MADYLENIDIEHIKRAIQAEEKYRYINLSGRETDFTGFMLKQLRSIYKLSGRNPEWKKILEAFEYYPNETILQRKKIINKFAAFLKEELHPEKKSQSAAKKENIYEADISELKGIGAKTAYALNKLEIHSVFDLISYYPRKYIDYSSRRLIKDLKEGETAVVYARIKSVSYFASKKGLAVFKVIVKDSSGAMELTFFQGKLNKYAVTRFKQQFPENAYIIISGKAKRNKYTNDMTIEQPQHQIADETSVSAENLNTDRIVPVYPLAADLNVKVLRKTVKTALDEYCPRINNIIPDELIKKHDMLERREALKIIHFPDSFEQLEKARYTIVYEEFFLLQMKMLSIRGLMREAKGTPSLNIKDDGLVMKYIKGLPFKLTNAQMRAVNEIINDMSGDKPMQRLLQGDVGSGKTAIACIMLLAAIENGYQTAIMAPTEILAQQHFNNFVSRLSPLGISIGLFTSSNSAKMRKNLEESLRNGQLNIAVGTHALIQDNIEFNNLGAVVIDEQHRFGVKQRNALKNKAKVPHMLTMTATPIPRTLAMTVYGDLDVTVIDELPAGRKPILTKLLKDSQRKKAYELIKQEVKKGHQAYIVFPLIDESETLSAKAASVEAERLQQEVFPDLKTGLLHGRMKPDEKDQVMKDFKNKIYDILVCTTVVEVGVDVSNASVMVIENAERFGLSQLHQLRGRVGRSNIQSYCILISSAANEETLYRLHVMEETNDGFVIAEKDLEIRGPGEFLGVRQSGIAELKLADPLKDAYILETVREEAKKYIENYAQTEYPEELKMYLDSVLSAVRELGISD